MNDIQIELDSPLAWVMLNRPERRNAVTSAMWQRLPAIATQLNAERSIRVAVLRGAGEVAFSAGADITEMAQNLAHPEQMRVLQEAVQVAQQAWADLALPTVAMIRGACTGGGCGLALACDLRIATPDSFFAIPPARLGLIYSLADTKRLLDLVGPARTKEILFTGRRIDAEEALRIGLINAVVPARELEATIRSLGGTIAGNAQSSVRGAKQIVNALLRGPLPAGSTAHGLYEASFDTPEFIEGARAFVEKRTPKF